MRVLRPGVIQFRSASEAAEAWAAVRSAASLAAIDEFIAQFGNVPVYGDMARAKRAELSK
jgi:hypothetical protein